MASAIRRIEERCQEAGLDVMAVIMGVLYDRENVSVETLVSVTASDSNIDLMYESFIAPAIDALERSLLNDYKDN